jgi:hypothetical protein
MLIPTTFEDLLPQGYTVMPTIMPPVIALLLPLPRRAPRLDRSLIKNFIRISALEVPATSFGVATT